MPYLQFAGLLVALVAMPILSALFKWLHFDPLSPAPRFYLWVAAVVALVIATATTKDWYADFGLGWPTSSSTGLAVLAAGTMFAVFGVIQYFQRKLGNHSSKQREQYTNILRLPFNHRLFLVVTAAVTEEVLYRGYAIGVGEHLIGSMWLACVLSVVAFTLAHIRWGVAHLLPVFISALVLTLLYAFTHNLWVCIIAHAIVDGAGFLLVPAIMARKHPGPLPNAS